MCSSVHRRQLTVSLHCGDKVPVQEDVHVRKVGRRASIHHHFVQDLPRQEAEGQNLTFVEERNVSRALPRTQPATVSNLLFCNTGLFLLVLSRFKLTEEQASRV